MSLPPLMQKGLSALLKVIKMTDPAMISETVTTLEEYFTLSAYEIAGAYQNSYESAINAIIAGLGKPSVFDSKVTEEFAQQIVPNYLQPFAAQQGIQGAALSQFCADSIANCQALIKCKLFQGEQTKLTETELAALITDTDSLSITELVLDQLRSHQARCAYLNLNDDRFVAFLRYNDVLGTAILFFLHEQLRKEPRVESTLAALQRQGLWQDVCDIKDSLKQLMTRLDLSPQIKAGDELTHHNQESLKIITDAAAKLKQLPKNNPQYSQLVIMGGSVLSSTGALAEAENLFIQAEKTTKNDAERALAAFNLFKVRVRSGEFEQALSALQEAISIDPQRYALHDVDKYPIEQILGAGGMGSVFLCRHKLQKKLVVIKCFWEHSEGTVEEVFKEAFAMSDIAGDYIPAPLDYGYVDPVKQERAFFVTEHTDGAVDGESWLKQCGKLDLENGLEVGLQIAKGLEVAHAAGIFHLDLKPANVLLKQTDVGIRVKLIDFGLSQAAQPLDRRQTQSKLSLLGQAVFGTLDYAAPEQQGYGYGKPSAKSDVFAFGATLYRLLTFESPRKLNPRRLANAPELFDLLCDCLEEEPRRRLSVADIIKTLEQLDKPLQHKQPQFEKKPETEQNDELEMLLDLARQKYEQGAFSIFDDDFHHESDQEKNELPIVCPYCDYIFTAADDGGVECPKCHWGFEIDDDGDVISSYDD